MRAKPSERLLAELAKVVETMDGTVTAIHILTPCICDYCRNEDVEAFPYHVQDRQGRLWADLCNDCFEALGCVYETADTAEEET